MMFFFHIAGLLFAMEDLSSFWSKALCWQTFFCSGIAALVASLFNTAFNAYEYQGAFGLLSISVSCEHVLMSCL